MKKIPLKTTITLTIVAFLAMAGVFYAANPSFFAPANQPIGVAAAPTDLIVSEYCSQNIDTLNCAGQVSLLATIPGPVGPCLEKYVAIAPVQSGNAGFTPRDLFVTQGDQVYQIRPPGPATPFATIPGCDADHTGITFDHVGTFGYKMIVTCNNGGVWSVDSTRTVTPIADTGTTLEGPAVVPLNFGPYGGQILVADETYPTAHYPGAVHAIDYRPGHTVTYRVFDWTGAEGVYVIPSAPCTFCSGGAFFQAIQNFNSLYQYPPTDFTNSGGSILVPSENGAGTALVTFDSSSGQYVTSSFDNIPNSYAYFDTDTMQSSRFMHASVSVC